tara:strand:- start:3921 stop:5282 length:1362 start_codon:yes stop_codon:yes gene_type:complete
MIALTRLPALSENRRLRLWAFFLFYISQGIPIGLMITAIPAWLAANGASTAEVGTLIAIVFLPWSLKLVSGLLMDRFCYRPMGRMRAWIIGSQTIMLIIFLAAAALAPGASDIMLLAGLGFALNFCAAFNDVAIDGMAVDLVPEEEREQTNAFMCGGQMIGISATAALASFILVYGGVALAMVSCALLILILTVVVTLLRERPGERLLPWTAGDASPENLSRGAEAWLPIIRQVLAGLFRWRTALFLLGAGAIVSSAGLADVFGPSFSVAELGWSSEYYSSFYSITGFVMVMAVMLLMGPLVSRNGARNMFIAFTGMMLLTNLAAHFALPNDFGTLAMQAYLTIFWGAFGGTAALFFAWMMNLTNPAVAAGQYALFMAIPNLVRSFSAGTHGQIIDNYGYDTSFLVATISIAAGITICLLAGFGRVESLTDRDGKGAVQPADESATLPQGMIA